MEARHGVKKKKAILRKIKRAMRAMCGRKVVDRKMSDEQMDMLGLKEDCRWVSNSEWSSMVWRCGKEG